MIEYLLKVTALDPRTKAKSVVEEDTWNKLMVEVVEILVCIRSAKHI